MSQIVADFSLSFLSYPALIPLFTISPSYLRKRGEALTRDKRVRRVWGGGVNDHFAPPLSKYALG